MADPLVEEYDALLLSWTRTLRRKADKTLATYVGAAKSFRDWLATTDDPVDVPEPVDRPAAVRAIASRHVHGWLNDQKLRGYQPAGINNRYRGLQQFFRWLLAEEELDANPMASMRPPKVPAKRVETIDMDHLRKLLATCRSPRNHDNCRDEAILRLLMDSGGRLAEITGLQVASIDFKVDAAYGTGKGDRPRIMSFGTSTSEALERYLRHRAKHKQANRPELWLGTKNRGPLTVTGIHQMIKRRCRQAGIPELHAHLFRHTMATEYLDNGGEVRDLMSLGGWLSLEMVQRYTDTTADRRAVRAHKRHSLSDRL